MPECQFYFHSNDDQYQKLIEEKLEKEWGGNGRIAGLNFIPIVGDTIQFYGWRARVEHRVIHLSSRDQTLPLGEIWIEPNPVGDPYI